jgi:hypothetical protein
MPYRHRTAMTAPPRTCRGLPLSIILHVHLPSRPVTIPHPAYLTNTRKNDPFHWAMAGFLVSIESGQQHNCHPNLKIHLLLLMSLLAACSSFCFFETCPRGTSYFLVLGSEQSYTHPHTLRPRSSHHHRT